MEVDRLGQALELAVMGAYVQSIRIANDEDLSYGSTPPHGFMLEDTMLEWKKAQLQAKDFEKKTY